MARLVRRLALVVTAGALGATLAATPAVAAPTWRPVTNLFADLSAAGGSAFTPAIGIDAAGNSTVVWSRYNGTQYVVQASYRPVGGAWTAPVDIAVGRMIFDPQLVVDAAGNETAIWRRVDADRSVVQTASRPAGGAWSAPVDLSTDPSVNLGARPDVPQLAVNAAGAVTATWSRFEAVTGQPWRYTAQSAARTADGTWSVPVELSPATNRPMTTDVTVDALGEATAVWSSASTVHTASRPAGGTWSAPTQISASATDRGNPRVVVDPAGTVTAIWGSFTGGAYGVQTASRAPGGAWSPPLDLVSGNVFDTPALAVDRDGNATALWQQNDGSGWVVTSASRPAGGAWGAPALLSAASGSSWDPQVAVDLAGNATAIWSREDDGGRVVEAARRTASEWSDPIELSPTGDAWNPQITVDRAGNATAAWSRKDGTSWIVQARGLDAAGPVVTEVTGATSRISARGRATYSVEAHDVWSRVASARWKFPDGTTAHGTSVSYAGTGTGPVRVVLTDSVGNATACTYTGTFACRPTTRIAPVIDKARLSTKKIRAVGSDARVAKKAKAVVVLTTDARVTLTFRKAGSKRVRVVERLDAGRNVVAIRARLGARKVLSPGRWTVVVTAKNKVSASPQRKLRLRVVR